MESEKNITRLTVEMTTNNYKILKKFAIDRNTTLKRLIHQAIGEYIEKNTGTSCQ